MAPTIVRRAPYKDFLQPALHRRFSRTAIVLVIIAYSEALVFARWESLILPWFPIGPTGIRASFLAVCGLAVIILRIAQYHVGLRTSTSAFESFAQNALKLQTAEAIFTYMLSSYLFSLIYLLSMPKGAGLDLFVHYAEGRTRLNEKPLFFISHMGILGFIQAIVHLYNDADRLSLGVARPKPQNGQDQEKNGDVGSQISYFLEQGPVILITSINQSIMGVIISAIIYPLILRGPVWRLCMTFLRPFHNLPKTNMLPITWPFSVWTLFRCFLASLMIHAMWTAGNFAFSVFLVRKPLKLGKPLTSESKDPNGSLLNGLKSKKLFIKSFAMWELAFIARDFQDRRKTIYEDIERKDGPVWSQVYVICLDVIKSMETRIDELNKPAPAPAPAPAQAAPESEAEKKKSPPPKDDPIFKMTPQKKTFRGEIEKAVTEISRSPGQGSPISPVAKQAVASAKKSFVQLQKQVTGSETPQDLFQRLALRALQYPVGIPFRQEYNRRLTSVVLGTPYGEPSLYINAVSALTQLVVHSLEEDNYGHVQRDIATILRTFTSVTKKLEQFKTELPTHWTDVQGERQCPEVDAILEALKEGLCEIVEHFETYARDLRLTATDMRLAREAAGLPGNNRLQEMLQVR